MATLAKTNNGISYWAADGEVSSKVKIKGRIQICTYDRVLGLPLKAALEILGSQNLGSDSVQKNWKFHELRASSGQIILKVKTDIEMGICKVFIHKDLFEIFLRGLGSGMEQSHNCPIFIKVECEELHGGRTQNPSTF